MKVVISGSRLIKSLPIEAVERINTIIFLEAEVLVGDAPGIDKLVQEYLHSCNYSKVTVCYAFNCPRNNVGKFKSVGGFASYIKRDEYMCKKADYGLAIWDGISKGTKANIARVSTRIVKV